MTFARAVVVGGVAVDTSGFDLSDHTSRVANVRTTNITLIILVGSFVGLRLFVRGYMVRKLFLDDGLILIAAAFTIALAAICIAATHHGLGTHVWLLPFATGYATVKASIQYLYIAQVLYACAIAFTKIAIIASYLRFIQDGMFRLAMYGTGFVIISLWFTGVFVTVFQCRPVESAWDFTIEGRKCLDYVNYLYASSALNVATDIILCVLPWPCLWRLNMPTKQRMILCLLFAGGAGACVASIVRIAYLYTLRSMDVTFQCVPCLNLSVIECSLGIICVSIPPLRPLAARVWFKDMMTRLRSDRSSSAKSPMQSLGLMSRREPPSHGAKLMSAIEADTMLDEASAQNAEYETGGVEHPRSSGPSSKEQWLSSRSSTSGDSSSQPGRGVDNT